MRGIKQCTIILSPRFKNVNLQMQSMVNILDLNKVTSQNIFVSDDLNPDLDPVQAISPVFNETSKFFTTLQCDLEHKFQHIVVSSNLSPDPSVNDVISDKTSLLIL